MTTLISLISGIIFGMGLYISQMTSPPKVIGFLDLTGNWDPSLAFVMVGAIGVFAITWRLIRKFWQKPYFHTQFEGPATNKLEWNLVIGPAFFGIGWGIAGICPGPAFANLYTFNTHILIFIAALVVGMYINKYVQKLL